MSLTLDDLIRSGEATIDVDDVARWRADGSWSGRTLRQVLAAVAAEHPDRDALVGYRSDGEVTRWTYRDFDAAATSASAALSGLGVAAGDAVAVMLPNWVEYGALLFGINGLGAIYTGVPVAYGERQAEAILRRSGAKVLVVPRRWRSVEHLELARRLRDTLPALEQLVVVDDSDDDVAFDEQEHLWARLTGPDLGPATVAADPSGVCYLGFTSGTTGEPKGAMHTHETLMHSVEQLTEHLGASTFGDPMVQLVASPTGHHTGFVWGVLFTVHLAGTGVHVDRWDPVWGVEIIRKEGVTCFFGAPAFLQDMLRTDLADDPACPLRCLVVAGSSVPRSLPARASQAFGAYIAPAWGMTECSITISCTPEEPAAVLQTDGSVFDRSGARVVDADGNDIPPGETGELLVRGPSMFLGYYQRPDATTASFRPGGWFATGDTASLDEHGWVSLRGRSKDIIIRGGENIPVTDIETLIFDHPSVVNAAVVGVPDERLGERTCAVVTLAPGTELDLDRLCDFLSAAGLSKHYLPERLVVLDGLPMTQSGKVQKFKLREMVDETGPDEEGQRL
ncbi:cyclohexanecarboxylate-CoA ligase [Nocardioides marmoriginsengisoli]|uniref:Cyclohexanecarboxylate-CoA ligase n=1 Tax=Nocardioides marmoriginsengisoli TaxID=661483 RepID=A0A3N0CII5_9ACTN|nr:AMP-binding protein [Nocardioides marmoriginsengisoli]RNL62816.1 cyclohexanecarboxylate-CoA ligase [Nocardioides marmoriginsengisoli]